MPCPYLAGLRFVCSPYGVAAVQDSDELPEKKKYENGVTMRSMLMSVVLTALAGVWVRQSEIAVLATQITESVPAIPGLAALVVMLIINQGIRFVPGLRPFTRGEVLVVFLFVTVSSTIMGIGIMQFLFALMTVPFYYRSDGLPELRPLLPSWLMPHDLTAIRHLYERSPDGHIPWEIWWRPGLLWLTFFFALWWVMTCMMTLFYRAWAEEEKLAFPLVFLPLEVTGNDTGSVPLLKNRLMWTGFGLAAGYNFVNILHAYYPSVPSIAQSIDLSASLKDLPWSAVSPLSFHFRPELIGLGYLVSTNISLTVWLSHLIIKFGSVFAASRGYEPHGLYSQEQGIGAYLVLAVMLIWQARKHLKTAWQSVFVHSVKEPSVGLSYRAVFSGLIIGFTYVCWFAAHAGMAWWLSVSYLSVVLAVALVYGRVRAQTGVPLAWLFPFAMPRSLFLYSFGSQPLVGSGPSTMPVWVLFSFLSRGYYTTVIGYQVEGMEIARRAKLDVRKVLFALSLAVIVGFIVGWLIHLFTYYHLGALHRVDGIWGSLEAVQEYTSAATMSTQHTLPDFQRISATAAGGLVVVLLSMLHLSIAGFPLHPLGYAMTCSYGELLWGPFFMVWILKSLALRYGGMRFYRQTIPFFLGFALGHFAVAGIFWGLIGGFSDEAVKGYSVIFG